MSLKKIIDWEHIKAKGELIGRIASSFYELYDDQQGFTWACDVDIGEPEVLTRVPIATNNKDILYCDVGKPVTLQRVGRDKYQIVGLAKTAISTTHIIYVSFEDAIGQVVNEELLGYYTRKLTLGELATYGGFGTVPLGAYARFTADGTFVSLIY